MSALLNPICKLDGVTERKRPIQHWFQNERTIQRMYEPVETDSGSIVATIQTCPVKWFLTAGRPSQRSFRTRTSHRNPETSRPMRHRPRFAKGLVVSSTFSINPNTDAYGLKGTPVSWPSMGARKSLNSG